MKSSFVLFVWCLLNLNENIEARSTAFLNLADSISPRVQVLGSTADSEQKKAVFAPFKRWSEPQKAVLLAGFIPGAGQLYNKKGVWWKLPLCYGAYGYTVYNHLQARRTYFFYKDIYELRVKNQPLPATLYRINVPVSYNTTDVSAFFRQKNIYRNSYERSFLLLGAAHLFAMADAFVTAHLRSFDVSDNLTMTIKPRFEPLSMGPGMSIGFGLK